MSRTVSGRFAAAGFVCRFAAATGRGLSSLFCSVSGFGSSSGSAAISGDDSVTTRIVTVQLSGFLLTMNARAASGQRPNFVQPRGE